MRTIISTSTRATSSTITSNSNRATINTSSTRATSSTSTSSSFQLLVASAALDAYEY